MAFIFHKILWQPALQYISRNIHTVFALLCFVVVIHWLIFPYPSGLLHWQCGNLTIAPVPANQPWWIWMNTSCEFIMNDCVTTTKQSTTKPCAYFLGYTVHMASSDCTLATKAGLSYTLGREYRVMRNRYSPVHGCYSLVKIAFAPICTCKNNRQIWRHNASIRVRVTSQINCGDVTMRKQKRPSLATVAKWAIDDGF